MRIKIIFFLFLVTLSVYSQNIKRKGSLGVGLYNSVPDSIYKKMNLKSNNGSLVQFVIPQTTADKLGVKPYDLITNCNNVAIQSTPSLIQLAKHFKDGDSISLIVIRNNSSLKLLGFVKGKPY